MLAVVASVTNSWAAAARPALHVAPRALAIRMQFISTIPEGLPDHLQDMAEEVCSGEATLFDVREPGEHAQGMLAIAQGLPLSMLQDGFFAGTDALDKFKSKTAYLHCAAGIRVHPAAECLQQLGFERVVPLQEGVRRSDSNPIPAPLAECLRSGCREENSKPLMMGRSIPVRGSLRRSTSWASRSRRIEITHPCRLQHLTLEMLAEVADGTRCGRAHRPRWCHWAARRYVCDPSPPLVPVFRYSYSCSTRARPDPSMHVACQHQNTSEDVVASSL